MCFKLGNVSPYCILSGEHALKLCKYCVQIVISSLWFLPQSKYFSLFMNVKSLLFHNITNIPSTLATFFFLSPLKFIGTVHCVMWLLGTKDRETQYITVLYSQATKVISFLFQEEFNLSFVSRKCLKCLFQLWILFVGVQSLLWLQSLKGNIKKGVSGSPRASLQVYCYFTWAKSEKSGYDYRAHCRSFQLIVFSGKTHKPPKQRFVCHIKLL